MQLHEVSSKSFRHLSVHQTMVVFLVKSFSVVSKSTGMAFVQMSDSLSISPLGCSLCSDYWLTISFLGPSQPLLSTVPPLPVLFQTLFYGKGLECWRHIHLRHLHLRKKECLQIYLTNNYLAPAKILRNFLKVEK